MQNSTPSVTAASVSLSGIGTGGVTIRRLDASDPGFAETLSSVLAFEASEDEAIDRAVAAILADVKQRGDAAVLAYTQQFDRVEAASVGALEIPQAELQAALASLEPARRAALQAAGVENTGVKVDTVAPKKYVAFKDPDRIAWEFYMV